MKRRMTRFTIGIEVKVTVVVVAEVDDGALVGGEIDVDGVVVVTVVVVVVDGLVTVDVVDVSATDVEVDDSTNDVEVESEVLEVAVDSFVEDEGASDDVVSVVNDGAGD